MWEIGLPAAYGPEGAAVTLLFPQSVATMSDDEIRQVLAGAVYMDAETLDTLNRRGFGELTGMTVEKALHEDCIEELTDHPLNAPFAGRQRDCRQSFYHVPGHVLKLADAKAQTLARLVDYGGQEKAATSMAVFENRLGGRIAVCGYYPWSFLHNLSKSTQMKSVMRWLSRDRLPAYVGFVPQSEPVGAAAERGAAGGGDGQLQFRSGRGAGPGPADPQRAAPRVRHAGPRNRRSRRAQPTARIGTSRSRRSNPGACGSSWRNRS